MKKAVLLLSSGLDSAANLVLGAALKQFEVKLALTVNYGQRSVHREQEQAKRLATYFQVEHKIFDFSHFPELLAQRGGALMGMQEIPLLQSTELDDKAVTDKTAHKVWVPNRNALLLSLAAALAESWQYDAVAVGFNAEEAVTFPDNTAAFMESVTQSFSFSTANHVRVMSATVSLTKTEIVRALSELSFPFELLWSCYHGGDKHCGQCESCQRLKRALTQGLKNHQQRKSILQTLMGDAQC